MITWPFTVFEWIGIVLLGIIALRFLWFILRIIYIYFIGPACNRLNFRNMGRWALVTGCTDGIGKEYARQLAAKGCDIILVSRSMDKLTRCADEIEKEFNVATKVVQADFTDGDAIYEKIGREIANMDIGTLVNNIGIYYPYPEYFLDIPEWDKFVTDMMNTNMVSVTRMTGLVLPGMVKRKKGVVINVSSLYAILPTPLVALYGASKAYVNKFTESLSSEYKKDGIIFQCTTPGLVVTNLSGLKETSFFAPSPKTYVKSALGLVGITSLTTGYLRHSFLEGFVMMMYNISESFIVNMLTKFNLKKRDEHFKKMDQM